MLIQDILRQSDAGSLLSNSDDTLHQVQNQVDELTKTLENMGKKSLRTTGMFRPTTVDELRRISRSITSTLSTRYGCND